MPRNHAAVQANGKPDIALNSLEKKTQLKQEQLQLTDEKVSAGESALVLEMGQLQREIEGFEEEWLNLQTQRDEIQKKLAQ